VDAREDRLAWVRRMRWRLRGAWTPSAFALSTIAGALLLTYLPPAGDRGLDTVGALLAAALLSLVAVAVAGPLLGAWLRRRNPRLPSFAARDRASAAALAALNVLLLTGGLAHRPALRAEQDDLRAQALAARAWFEHNAPAAYRANRGRMDTWKPGPDFFRTCIPGSEPHRSLCVYVDTDRSPPQVVRDHSQVPNRELVGPGEQVVLIR
jgi:hypothetical protein